MDPEVVSTLRNEPSQIPTDREVRIFLEPRLESDYILRIALDLVEEVLANWEPDNYPLRNVVLGRIMPGKQRPRILERELKSFFNRLQNLILGPKLQLHLPAAPSPPFLGCQMRVAFGHS